MPGNAIGRKNRVGSVAFWARWITRGLDGSAVAICNVCLLRKQQYTTVVNLVKSIAADSAV